jgi:hypothetical protein
MNHDDTQPTRCPRCRKPAPVGGPCSHCKMGLEVAATYLPFTHDPVKNVSVSGRLQATCPVCGESNLEWAGRSAATGNSKCEHFVGLDKEEEIFRFGSAGVLRGPSVVRMTVEIQPTVVIDGVSFAYWELLTRLQELADVGHGSPSGEVDRKLKGVFALGENIQGSIRLNDKGRRLLRELEELDVERPFVMRNEGVPRSDA